MQKTETPAAELLEQALQHPQRRKKKDFIESLRHRRMLYLDRAAMCEELIQELGGSIEEPMVDEMTTEDLDMPQEIHPRRRHQPDSQTQEEGRPLNQDGSPDLRRKENFDVRAEESGEGGRQTSHSQQSTSHGSRESQHPVEGASHEPGSSPEAEGGETPLTKEGEPDRRYKPEESEAQYNARHMLEVPEGEKDGRGEVKNPEKDLRLKQNLGKRARIAEQQGKAND